MLGLGLVMELGLGLGSGEQFKSPTQRSTAVLRVRFRRIIRLWLGNVQVRVRVTVMGS